MSIERVLEIIDSNQNAALSRLFDLMSIPSVSTDPAFAPQCERAAEWLVDQLSSIGFHAQSHKTKGHPMVLAHARAQRSDVPHILFYGHYDVQPADPLELWTTEPFTPRVGEIDGRACILGRGSADDKGQLMTFIEACRAFHATGAMPCHITILLEGEEETGSPSLPQFIEDQKQALKADLMLVCDTNMWDRDTPAITTMLRGLLLEEVTIKAADRDLHSGMFGGPAINPIRVLSKIIADIHEPDGRISLDGFYDGVDEVPEEIMQQWRNLPFSESGFLADVGLAYPAGEDGRSVLEMIWSRPTCDVNGMVGGYIGKGSKTVLPAQASAKFSFRLVGRQNPEAIRDSFRRHVHARLPRDCRVEFHSHGASPAIQLPIASEALSRARFALMREWNREAVLIGSGGSIPIVGAFKRELNMDALMIGFGLEDDRIHSPNEKYELSSFHKGARSWARILHALSL
jgi:acetylornithine deacetylase/succinyl-diaminopimelate desuccinylase-like protein